MTEGAMQLPQRKIKYVYQDMDRHGNVRTYFWRGKGQRKVRIVELVDTEPFHKKYHELLRLSQGDGSLMTSGRSAPVRPTAGTYRWLCEQYMASAKFRQLDDSTQRARRRVLEQTYVEPTKRGGNRIYADMPLVAITTEALTALRDRKADLPEAGNVRVKALRQVFKWALKQKHMRSNPARDVERFESRGDGFHAWTQEEVAQYEERHPIGTKARLALALMLWTGVRRSDVVLLGRQHLRNGWLRFTARKNRNRKPVTVEIPVLPELQHVIDASQCGDLTFLMTDHGKPFQVAGFGNWFRDRCVEAGVPGRAHGLRKAGSATAAENGATAHQLMAIFGWRTLAEAERYTREAKRKKMAGEAMRLLVKQG